MVEPSSSVFAAPNEAEGGAPRHRLPVIAAAVGVLALLAGLTGSLLTNADAAGGEDRPGGPSTETRRAPLDAGAATPAALTSDDGVGAASTPSTTAPTSALEVSGPGDEPTAVAPSGGGGTGGDDPAGAVYASPASPTTIAPPATTIPPTTAPPADAPADDAAGTDTGTATVEDDG